MQQLQKTGGTLLAGNVHSLRVACDLRVFLLVHDTPKEVERERTTKMFSWHIVITE